MYPEAKVPNRTGTEATTFHSTLKRPDMSRSWPTRAMSP